MHLRLNIVKRCLSVKSVGTAKKKIVLTHAKFDLNIGSVNNACLHSLVKNYKTWGKFDLCDFKLCRGNCRLFLNQSLLIKGFV